MARAGTRAGGGRGARRSAAAPPAGVSDADVALTAAQRLELHYCADDLRQPVEVHQTFLDVPLPYAPSLEDDVLPQTADIVVGARHLAAY